MLFTTGRHYARCNFSGKTVKIDGIAPEALAEVNAADAERLSAHSRHNHRAQPAGHHLHNLQLRGHLALDALDRLSRTIRANG